MVFSYFTARSTSTGNLLAKKIEELRRSSDQESSMTLTLHSALHEVSNGAKSYDGKMLKKFTPSENGLRRKRSRSMDTTSHFRIK